MDVVKLLFILHFIAVLCLFFTLFSPLLCRVEVGGGGCCGRFSLVLNTNLCAVIEIRVVDNTSMISDPANVSRPYSQVYPVTGVQLHLLSWVLIGG
jgi:hypothetical protein